MSTDVLPAGLYALIDDGICPERPLIEKAQRAVEGGARALQLRMKNTPAREALRAAREVVALCRAAGAVCLVNDRVDWALLSNADGVHLGDEDIPVEDARAVLGPRKLIGATVRSLDGVQAAQRAGASYVGLGPIFHTRTKVVAHALLGLAGLEQIAARSPLPVVAIAGITLENIALVARAGAHGAAVASDLLCAEDPTDRARQLSQAFAKGAQRA